MKKNINSSNSIRCIIKESIKEVLSERKVVIDNFEKISKLMDFNSDDDFYFVQIIRRRKDNKDDNAGVVAGKKQGIYHSGGWYLKSWRVRSSKELLDLKKEIIDICEKNNARAYITINTRSEKETNNYVKIYRSKFPTNDPRYLHADEIVPGQAKTGPNWKNVRPRLFVDVDSDNKKIQNEVLRMLSYYNIKILDTYETPSGGLHIILPDKNDKNLWYFKKELSKFDNFKDKGKLATVAVDEDAKILLYANVEAKY